MEERFILASASPQRRELLEHIGVSFEVHPCELPETDCKETEPLARNQALARTKAEDVAGQFPAAFVLGCDTLVVVDDGTMLEKPTDAAHAREMLLMQRGKVSIVHSSLCLIAPSGEQYEDVSSSKVYFKNLSDQEVDWWISTGLWEDRSGSFQIDGPGQLMIERLEGDWSGVVGLPVYIFGELAKKAGLNLF